MQQSRTEAERQTQIESGNYERCKEECREALGTRLLQELAADVCYGLRQLHRNAAFTTVAILTLALRIGVNSATFSVVDAMFLRPLSVARRDQLVRIYMKTPQGPDEISYPDLQRLKGRVPVFSGFPVWDREAQFLNFMDRSNPILVGRVLRDYFRTLDIPAILRRTFLLQMHSGPGRGSRRHRLPAVVGQSRKEHLKGTTPYRVACQA